MKKHLHLTTVLFFITIAVSILASCTKELSHNYSDKNAPPPLQVTGIKVTPILGGAIVTYKVPDDVNLSYVKAVYELHPGVYSETKSSVYSDSLKIEGFGNTQPRKVDIYSVGKNEKQSEPVTVTIEPLEPPIKAVFNSLKIDPTFGGVRVRFLNTSRANLAMVLMVSDSTKNNAWKEVKTIYTSQDSGSVSVRGLGMESQRFSLYIRDRWNNRSDTVIRTIQPLFEEEIPKTRWKPVYLPTDTYEYVETFDITKVYDGVWANGRYDAIFATKHTSPIPQWFTLDLGRTVLLSRMKYWHFFLTPYSGESVKEFELYGSNDPAPDGSWDSWQLLGAFQSYKPSGLPYGQVSGEDRNYGMVNGEDFEFSDPSIEVRYIRFKTIQTYGSSGPFGQVVLPEISLWGKVLQ